MSAILQRPAVASRERHELAADAFLYSAVVMLLGIGIQELVAVVLAGGRTLETMEFPVWVSLLGSLSMPVALLVGALLAWRLHGRPLRWRDVLGGVVGAVVGGVAMGAAFFALFSLWRFVPAFYPRDEQGPWDLGVVVAVLASAFLAKPVIGAVRDLAGARTHAGLDWLRLAALILVLAAVVVSLVVGGEGAELGLFLVPVAAGGAAAVLGMELLEARSLPQPAGGASFLSEG